MKKIYSILFLFFVYKAYSQETSKINFKEIKNNIRLNFIQIEQPDLVLSGYQLKPKMGLMGFNYNIHFNEWLYTGVGIHAAVTGDQGGLFTLGVNLGVNKKIYKNIFFDANVHFGGGGGFRRLVNGGGIIYPKIGLQYKNDSFSFGAQYGYVNFFTGIQKGDNISFFLEIPSKLVFGSYKEANKEYIFDDENKRPKKTAVKNAQLVTLDYFFPIGNSRNDGDGDFLNTTPLNQTLYIIGFEYQKYIRQNTFLYVHTDTMYGGLTSGFMDLFFGIGHNFLSTRKINLYAKAGIGAAGGRIFPEGGITAYPSAGIDYKISKKFALSAHGGIHRAIGGTFEAYTLGFSLKYFGISGGFETPFEKDKISKIFMKGIRIGVINQTYINVARDRTDSRDLQLIAVKSYFDLNKRFYLSAEASFAYLGNSGGYAHGMFASGIKSNTFMNDKISMFAEFAFGVAGGGRVDSGEGVMMRPNAGINLHINNSLNLILSGGRLISPFGNVNSTNFNIGLSYGLTLLKEKK
ncbi:MAG: hypothetical protein AB8B78_14550 [Polaribacter sp.]